MSGLRGPLFSSKRRIVLRLFHCFRRQTTFGSLDFFQETAFPPTLPTDPSCKSWILEEEECKCSCMCICVYSPSGRVLWLK